MPGFTFRDARSADGPAVSRLVFAVLREFGLAPDAAATDADLLDLDTSYARRGGAFELALGADGALLGCAGLYRVSADVCELRKMYLLPSARGQGLGRALLERALARARELGYRRMTLETASVLKDAIRLYTAYGFRPVASGHLASRCDQRYELNL